MKKVISTECSCSFMRRFYGICYFANVIRFSLSNEDRKMSSTSTSKRYSEYTLSFQVNSLLPTATVA